MNVFHMSSGDSLQQFSASPGIHTIQYQDADVRAAMLLLLLLLRLRPCVSPILW